MSNSSLSEEIVHLRQFTSAIVCFEALVLNFRSDYNQILKTMEYLWYVPDQQEDLPEPGRCVGSSKENHSVLMFKISQAFPFLLQRLILNQNQDVYVRMIKLTSLMLKWRTFSMNVGVIVTTIMYPQFWQKDHTMITQTYLRGNISVAKVRIWSNVNMCLTAVICGHAVLQCIEYAKISSSIA